MALRSLARYACPPLVPATPSAHPAPLKSQSSTHSDRGRQYRRGAYRQILRHAGMRQSSSASANPDHNAWTEIFGCIDSHSNTQRKPSSPGDPSPA